jgi:hypothetical protein
MARASKNAWMWPGQGLHTPQDRSGGGGSQTRKPFIPDCQAPVTGSGVSTHHALSRHYLMNQFDVPNSKGSLTCVLTVYVYLFLSWPA